jgi:hypothetical protein
MTDGYYCVICGRYLEADDESVIVHDPIPHPDSMTFNDDEKPQCIPYVSGFGKD